MMMSERDHIDEIDDQENAVSLSISITKNCLKVLTAFVKKNKKTKKLLLPYLQNFIPFDSVMDFGEIELIAKIIKNNEEAMRSMNTRKFLKDLNQRTDENAITKNKELLKILLEFPKASIIDPIINNIIFSKLKFLNLYEKYITFQGLNR
jgi:hypothetical protein